MAGDFPEYADDSWMHSALPYPDSSDDKVDEVDAVESESKDTAMTTQDLIKAHFRALRGESAATPDMVAVPVSSVGTAIKGVGNNASYRAPLTSKPLISEPLASKPLASKPVSKHLVSKPQMKQASHPPIFNLSDDDLERMSSALRQHGYHSETKTLPVPSFKGDATSQTRPKAKMRAPYAANFQPLDDPNSGFSSRSTLAHASKGEKANFAALLTSSIDPGSYEMRGQDGEHDMPDEDVRDAIAYGSLARAYKTPTAEPESPSNTTSTSLDIEALLDAAAKEMELYKISAEGSANKPLPANKPLHQGQSKKSTEKASVFLRPSTSTHRSQLASAQAHASLSSTSLRPDTTFPDKDNIFYQPQMTLSSAAQQIVNILRAANALTAHHCDEQMVHTSNLKPVVIKQMHDMMRDLYWVAQFLRLGKLGWDLVKLPHAFYDDVKNIIPGLTRQLEQLGGRKGLGFLTGGLWVVNSVERAVCTLQATRKEQENQAKIKWEATRREQENQAKIKWEVKQIEDAVQALTDKYKGDDEGFKKIRVARVSRPVRESKVEAASKAVEANKVMEANKAVEVSKAVDANKAVEVSKAVDANKAVEVSKAVEAEEH